MTINNLHQLVEKQAKKTPDQTALLYLDKKMSYAQLNAQANQLAHYLRLKQVSPEEPIAICIERCFDLFVAILAVLKAGCAYVPLEPRQPPKRLQWIIGDSKARILLTQSHLMPAFEDLPIEKIRVDVERDILRAQNTDNLDLNIEAHHLAYIIYTSGSTGQPKGVCVEHGSVLNLVQVESNLFQVDHQSKVLQFASIGFDASVLEWTLALTQGAMLCLLPVSSKKSTIEAFYDVLSIYKVDIAFFPPTLVETDSVSPDLLPELKTLGVGGDVCTSKILLKWAPYVRLINAYGPTEVTVFSLAFVYDDTHPPATIGYPIKNTDVYLFNDDLQSVPEGEMGEIYIGGACLARGYLNRPESTQKNFIAHPFKLNERLYKTGDLGRCLPDGAIEYIGRVDEQVKIRGHRVELYEVSNVLLKIAGISEVVTLVDPTRKEHLISFIRIDPSVTPVLTEDIILKKAKESLPDYMLPKTLVFLEKFELNTSGKYNRERLLEIYNEKKSRKKLLSYIALNIVEEELIQIARGLLHYDQLDTQSDLLQNGLDSILILQFISRAREQGISIQPKQIYQKRTIQDISSIAKKISPLHPVHLPIQMPGQLFDLSPIQRWFFEHEFVEHRWAQAGYLKIQDPDLHIACLERACHDLAKYHVSLNLRFLKTESGWQQAYSTYASQPQPLSVIVIHDRSEIKAHLQKQGQAISITSGPLIKALLFHQSSSTTYYLYFIIHHLVLDGISWRVLLEDVAKLYSAYVKQEEPLISQTQPYQAWIEKLGSALKKPEIWADLAYWEAVLAKVKLCLPVKNESAQDRVEHCRTLCFKLEQEETHSLLHEIHAVYGTEINAILLAALAILFQQVEGEKKLALCLNRHGREPIITEEADFSRTVGWFTSVSPICLEFAKTDPEDLIPSIKAQLEDIPHQGVSYGLLRYLTGDDPRTAPLRAAKEPRINFNYYGQWYLDFMMTPNWRFMNLDLEGGMDGKSRTTEDLLFLSCIKGGQFRLFLTYNQTLYSHERMMVWGQIYLAGLRDLIRHCLDKKVVFTM